MLGTTLGSLNRLLLGTFGGTDLESLEGSTDGTAGQNLKVLFLGS